MNALNVAWEKNSKEAVGIKVKNQVVWITGASQGIGRCLALNLAKSGCKVAATSRTKDDLMSLQDRSKDLPGEIQSYPCDVTDEKNIEILIKSIETNLGPIDLAILNAGTYIRFGVDDFSVKAFRKQIEINTMGTVNCLAPVMHNMKARRNGHIVVVSSLSAYRGLPFASAYGASKAALTNMCESLKPELDNFKVKLSVVHPGFVDTPLTNQNDFKMPFLVDVEFASKRILAGINRGKFEIVFPSTFSLIMKLFRSLPYSLYFLVTKRMVKK